MSAHRRGIRLLAWGGSLGLAVAGLLAGSAGAVTTPSYTYSSSVTAIGIQTALFSNPEPSSVPDLTDVQVPSSDSHLDSFGTSEADAHLGNLNGLGQLPSLVCLASAAACNAIPIKTLTAGLISSFPPADPLDAHSTYPANQTATAPAVGSKTVTIGVAKGPFTLGSGTVTSSAHELTTSTSAVTSNLGLLGGISVGSARTTTTQTATGSGLQTTAVAQIANIDIGTKSLLHIGSVRSTASVLSRPDKPATDNASTVISGVKVLGKPATIDKTGVHVSGAGLPAAVQSAYQKVLDTVLNRSGLGLKEAGISRSNGHTGHTVTVDGLELFFKHTVAGTQPITIGLPDGIPCPIESITGKLPVDPCAGVGLSLNAKYRGQIALGEVGIVSMAQPNVPNPSRSVGPTSPSPTGGVTTGGGSGVAGAGGGIPSGGSIPSGGTPDTGSFTSAPVPGNSPQVAGAPATVADPLSGLSGRVWWFFPLIGLSLLAVAGRFRFPARLPAHR